MSTLAFVVLAYTAICFGLGYWTGRTLAPRRKVWFPISGEESIAGAKSLIASGATGLFGDSWKAPHIPQPEDGAGKGV